MTTGPNYTDDADRDEVYRRGLVPLFASLEEFFAAAGWDAETQAKVRAEMLLSGIVDDVKRVATRKN